VTPPGFSSEEAADYRVAGEKLLTAYHEIHARAKEHLAGKLACPEDMKREAYDRNITARAFDVARYVLFFGIPTGVGQVTSIRTLERQIRRLKASEYAEVRELADEIAAACSSPPDCPWDEKSAMEPVAPTLARHVDPDEHAARSRADLTTWGRQNLPSWSGTARLESVDLIRPTDTHSEIAATLLYPVSNWPFRELYELARSWSAARRNEVIDVALRSRTRRDELLRGFRGGLYAFDIVMDIGAYRDMHRHRRCQQYRQDYSGELGYDTPEAIVESGAGSVYESAMKETFAAIRRLPAPASHYLLPFGARSRFLFKMDFAEAEYIVRLRSGVKGHFSYRKVAWDMKCAMERAEPELGRLMEATPPWVEDPLKR
jgi:thymidylate synthase ThyX